MEDLENGFGSAWDARTEQEVSFHGWRHVSCQSFPQIHLRLKNISQAVKDHSWYKRADQICDPFVRADKEMLCA